MDGRDKPDHDKDDAKADRCIARRVGWMTLYWFKPKAYGYGATPANWQGWVATGVFVIGVMALSLLLLGLEPKPGTGLGSWRIGIWALMVAGLTVGFIWLSRVKSDGQWGWRWGK